MDHRYLTYYTTGNTTDTCRCLYKGVCGSWLALTGVHLMLMNEPGGAAGRFRYQGWKGAGAWDRWPWSRAFPQGQNRWGSGRWWGSMHLLRCYAVGLETEEVMHHGMQMASSCYRQRNRGSPRATAKECSPVNLILAHIRLLISRTLREQTGVDSSHWIVGNLL